METIKHLLGIEYLKFKKSSILNLLILLYAFIFPLVIFSAKRMIPDFPDSVPFTVDILYEFPTVWDYQGYIGTWLVFIFLGFIPIHIVCSEFSQKTMRQSIINGLTRKQYFTSKLLTITAISLAATAYYFLVCSVIGWFNTPNPSISKLMNNDFAGFRYFLSCMGYMSIAFLLAIWIKRSGLALFTYLSYIIIIEPAARWLIYWKVLKTKATLFFPANILEDVMPNPLYRFAEMAPDEMDMDWLMDYSVAVPIASVFTIALFGGAYYLFKNGDI